jgi:hypothetical protein
MRLSTISNTPHHPLVPLLVPLCRAKRGPDFEGIGRTLARLDSVPDITLDTANAVVELRFDPDRDSRIQLLHVFRQDGYLCDCSGNCQTGT